jgi:hypothetical protein
MDFTIKIDITERLEKSLQALTTAIFNARVFPTPEECRSKYFADPEAGCISQEKAENLPVETPEEPAPIIAPPVPENVPEAKSERPMDEKPEAVEAPAQNDNTEPEPPKASEKKPTKKRTSKKAENLPAETPKEPVPINTPVESENAPQAKSEQPADAEPEQSELKASDDDPMCGMTVMEAMQAVMDEISEKGLDMADVNARVRARAAEAGIVYSSIICMIKAIGYKETRRVALGEK